MKRGYVFISLFFMLMIIAKDAPTAPEKEKLTIPNIQQTVSFFTHDQNCPWRRTTQTFGQSDQSSDGGGKMHTGTDVACRAGAEIRSPFTCRVIKAEDSPGGWGTNVICKASLPSGQQICYRVAHMISGSLQVQQDDLIVAGQLIGLEGTTGASSGVHAHFQLLDCNSYPYALDDGYAGKSDDIKQLRYFYSPLQFLYEWKDPNLVYSSLNMVRHETDGSFSAHSWVSTQPQYLDAEDLTNLTKNNWEQRFIRRGYSDPGNQKEAIYYLAKYLVTKQNNYSVTFKPFLPRKGTWQAFLKVPNDASLSGSIRVRVHFKAWFHQPNDPLLVDEIVINQGPENHGKYIRLGGNLNCLRGKNCYVEVITKNPNGALVGVESIKWKYITDMYDEFYSAKAVYTGQEHFWINYPEQTEVGIIRLSYAPWLTQYNIDLYAEHRTADGKSISLPCVRSNEAGKEEYCIYLQGKKGDRLHIWVKNPQAPFCSGQSCYGVLVSVNNYPVMPGSAGLIPAGNTLCADSGDQNTWYSKWLYFAGLTGIMTGVQDEDYSAGICLYRPGREVKKAEFTKMIINATTNRVLPACTVKPYDDVEITDWFCPYVQQLKKQLPADFVWDGRAPKLFFPAQAVNRQIAAYMTVRALNLTLEYSADRAKIFCDVSGARFKKEILTLNYFGMIHGFKPDVSSSGCSFNFDPYGILNRAQAAKIAVQAFKYAYYNGGF